MKKILMGAAAAAVMALGSTGAMANECNLNAQQLENGWTCTPETTTGAPIPSYERAGQSHMCQYFEATTTITQWVGRNPSGRVNDAHSSEPQVDTGDPVKVGGNVPCPS